MEIKAYGLTDIGRLREENQDNFLVDESLRLFMVADGMGGMDDGAAASLFTIKGLYRIIQSYWEAQDDIKDTLFYIRYIRKSINDVNKHLHGVLGKRIGSTVVLAQIVEDEVLFVNVGDSPGYLYRGGKLKQMTKDHNIAAAMAQMKQITPAEAKTHPAHNRLTAYIGMDGKIQASVCKARIQPGDRLLLCSDGLAGIVEEPAIETLLGIETDVKAAAKKLVDMANESGGTDNITVVLAEIKE